MKTKIQQFSLLFIFIFSLNAGWAKEEKSLKEIAYDAFIYAYPMIEQVKTINAMKQAYPGFGPNKVFMSPNYPLDNIGQPIVAPNFTSMTGLTQIDISNGPVVFEVPEVKDRYIVHQAIDVYTYNFFYMGTKADGGKAGRYIFYNKFQEIPSHLKGTRVLMEDNLAVIVTRIDIKDRSELKRVHEIQKGIKVTPVSDVTRDYPVYSKEKEFSPAFVEYINELIIKVPYNEKHLYREFAKIGVFNDSVALSATDSAEIQAGIDSAYATITSTKFGIGNGWTGATNLFGDRPMMNKNYLNRAIGAYFGLWGNSKQEANYYMAFTEGEGTLTFTPEQIPPLTSMGFFSITVYDSTAHATKNQYDSYVLTMEDLKYEEDGSLVVHISKTPQDGNWLYMPTEKFDILLRVYMADPAKISDYTPPQYIQNK